MLGILSKLHDSLCLSSSDHFKFHDVHAFASLGLPFFKHVEVATYEDYLLVSVVTGDSFREQNKTVIFKVYQASNQVLYLFHQDRDPFNSLIIATSRLWIWPKLEENQQLTCNEISRKINNVLSGPLNISPIILETNC